MRVSLCLSIPWVLLTGCFLDHGAPGGHDPDGRAGAPLVGLCSLSDAAIYPKSLTLFREADCHESRPVDACDVTGPTRPVDAAPSFDVSTTGLSTRGDDASPCDTLPHLAATGTCDLPIAGVGSYRVSVDGRDGLMLHIPYDSSVGASCWAFGGECVTGSEPVYDLPPRVPAGEAIRFELGVHMDLTTPRPTGCEITIEDGGTRGWVDPSRILIRMTFEDAYDESCIGIGRHVRCLLPPLDGGDYEVVLPEGEVAAVTAI